MSELLPTIIAWIPFVVIIIVWVWIGMRQYKKRGKITIFILLFLFICWHFYGLYERVKPPPAYADSLITFIDNVDTSSYRILLMTINNREYFKVTGPWSPLFLFKTSIFLGSGPPGYIFNQKGELIDWTRYVEDDPLFRDRWTESDEKEGEKYISFEDALELIKESLQNPLKKQEDR